MNKLILIISIIILANISYGKGFWFISIPVHQDKIHHIDDNGNVYYDSDVKADQKRSAEIQRQIDAKSGQYYEEFLKNDRKWKAEREEKERIKLQKQAEYQTKKNDYDAEYININVKYNSILSNADVNYKSPPDVLLQCLSVSNKYDQEIIKLKNKYYKRISFLQERHGLKEGYYNNAKELMTSNDPIMVKTRTRMTMEYNIKIVELNKEIKDQMYEYAQVRDERVKEILRWNKNNTLRGIDKQRESKLKALKVPELERQYSNDYN